VGDKQRKKGAEKAPARERTEAMADRGGFGFHFSSSIKACVWSLNKPLFQYLYAFRGK